LFSKSEGTTDCTDMNIEEIKRKIRDNRYAYTQHAETERRVDSLTFHQVEEALLTGKILEQYPDTGRGECCLVVGFSGNIPIHIVCGQRGEDIVIITLYIPGPPKFADPYTRRR